jgi:aldehyde dehydrogenase (NAD+)
MGAIRTPRLHDRLLAELGAARERGATIVAGGEAVDVPGRRGRYLTPALLEGLANDDVLASRELFGPLAMLIPFRDEREAVELANDSDFGLAAGIWSSDFRRLERVWRQLDVGTVYVNSYHRVDGIPLAASGRWSSGFGAEIGQLGVEEFLVPKSVHIARSPL